MALSDFNGACGSSTKRFSPSKTHGIADRLSEVCSVTANPRMGYRSTECELGVNPNAYRFWKIDQVTVTGSTVIEVGEWVLVNRSGTYLSGIDWYNGGLMYNEAIGSTPKSAYADGVLGTRAFQILIPNDSANYVTYDFGTPVECNGLAYTSFFNPSTRYMTGFRVQASADDVTYETIATLSGLSVDNSANLKIHYF